MVLSLEVVIVRSSGWTSGSDGQIRWWNLILVAQMIRSAGGDPMIVARIVRSVGGDLWIVARMIRSARGGPLGLIAQMGSAGGTVG
jgi:hypothetical protein